MRQAVVCSEGDDGVGDGGRSNGDAGGDCDGDGGVDGGCDGDGGESQPHLSGRSSPLLFMCVEPWCR
jgi:hypothetical protein